MIHAIIPRAIVVVEAMAALGVLDMLEARTKDLKTCREEIDAIDKEIIALFEKRMHVSKDVITYKLAHDMNFQKDREKKKLSEECRSFRR